jgi:hypothetical protein
MNSTRSVTVFGALMLAASAMTGACSSSISPSGELPPENTEPEAPVGGYAPKAISPLACLRKAALDLVERAPSPQEIDAVRTGAKSIGDVVDNYLSAPEFSEVVFHWFLQTFEPTTLVPATADKEEPARIAQYVVTKDLDFRQLVTADYTVGTDREKKAAGADAAGVLSTQAYLSAYSGLENRNWAGRLLRVLMGTVLVPVTEVPEGIDSSKTGLASNPACAGCHTNPIYGVDYAAAFHDCYDNKGLPIAGCVRQTDSLFLGQSGRSLADLGKILAASPEWRAAMIQAFYTNLGGRPMGKNETSQYFDYEEAWVAADYRPKALIKQIATSSYYCSR